MADVLKKDANLLEKRRKYLTNELGNRIIYDVNYFLVRRSDADDGTE